MSFLADIVNYLTEVVGHLAEVVIYELHGRGDANWLRRRVAWLSGCATWLCELHGGGSYLAQVV